MTLAACARRWKAGRAKGRDIEEMASYLPPALSAYIQALGTTECEKFAAADPRHVAEFIQGTRPKIEGCRSGAELRGEQMSAKYYSPPPADVVTPQEQVVLATLAARLKARGRVAREADDDNVGISGYPMAPLMWTLRPLVAVFST